MSTLVCMQIYCLLFVDFGLHIKPLCFVQFAADWSYFTSRIVLLSKFKQKNDRDRKLNHITWLVIVSVCRPEIFSAMLSAQHTTYSVWACVWMAPFSFLIDDYWMQSDGSSLLANTREETTAKTTFLSDWSLNFRLMSCWQTQTLHGSVLQCPLPSFLCSIPESLWNLQSQH